MSTLATCFEQHAAMKLDANTWSSLPLVGHMETEDDEGKPCLIEMRNCTRGCHSTLGVFIPLPAQR